MPKYAHQFVVEVTTDHWNTALLDVDLLEAIIKRSSQRAIDDLGGDNATWLAAMKTTVTEVTFETSVVVK